MSYKTNPIANRLNVNKGFYNPYFLSNKAAHNHNLILWLSLYLFLKSYLAFKKIRLLSCEIRTVSQSYRALFISILKNPQKKKKKKYKNIYRSPINQSNNKNAIYLLYKNMYYLKKIYIMKKKKNHRNLKLYYKSIKKLFLIYKRRKIFNILKAKKLYANKSYKLIYKDKLTINILKAFFLKKKTSRIKNIANQINEFKKFTRIFHKTRNIKNILFNIWARTRLKKIKIRLKKIKRSVYVFRRKRLRWNQKYFIRRKKELKFELFRKTFYLKQLRRKTPRFLETNNLYFLINSSYYQWKLFFHRPQMYLRYFIFYKKLNKRLLSFFIKKLTYSKFSKKNQHLLLSRIKKNIYRHRKLIKKLYRSTTKKKTLKNKSLKYIYFSFVKKKKKKHIHIKIIWKHITRMYLKNKKTKKLKRQLKTRKLFKLTKPNFIILKKKPKFSLKWKKKIFVAILKKYKHHKKIFAVRQKKKKKLHIRRFFKKKKKRKDIIKQKKFFFLTNKDYIKKTVKEDFFKRKTQQTISQLQFLLGKLISQYFKITFIVKVNNLFTLFNNKKIFFETFQTKRHKANNKELVISSSKYPKQLPYLKINRFNVLKVENNIIKVYNENKAKIKENFFLGKKGKILGKSFYTLVNYHKYLDAQLLADEISRLMSKRKHHTTIFHTVKTLLDAFPETTMISYHIIVNGKINSKSRATNVIVSQGHIPAQYFSARVNFGLAQAKTPTGTFGIKVYMYF